MRLFEEIGGNVQEKEKERLKSQEKKKSTLRAFASRANNELKTPSVEIACLLGIQNERQAVWLDTYLFEGQVDKY